MASDGLSRPFRASRDYGSGQAGFSILKHTRLRISKMNVHSVMI